MKIYVLMDGGLGNQLFEYAFGRAFSIRTGGELIMDPWDCIRGTTRPMQLHHFNIRSRFPTVFENIICRLVDAKRLEIPRNVLRKVVPGALPKLIRQKKHFFDPAVFENRGSVFVDGWWQSELYFRDHRDVILPELTLRDPPNAINQQCLDQIRATNAVCIHARRGDYVTDPRISRRIGACGLEYYQAAIDLIRQRVPSPTFFVFSDDPEWTRQNLPVPEPRHFINHNCKTSDWEDLRLMSACKHFVIANSTFSWWGAWLSTHIEKLVIAPKTWFADETISDRDMIPTDWIQL